MQRAPPEQAPPLHESQPSHPQASREPQRQEQEQQPASSLQPECRPSPWVQQQRPVLLQASQLSPLRLPECPKWTSAPRLLRAAELEQEPRPELRQQAPVPVEHWPDLPAQLQQTQHFLPHESWKEYRS